MKVTFGPMSQFARIVTCDSSQEKIDRFWLIQVDSPMVTSDLPDRLNGVQIFTPFETLKLQNVLKKKSLARKQDEEGITLEKTERRLLKRLNRFTDYRLTINLRLHELGSRLTVECQKNELIHNELFAHPDDALMVFAW